MDFDRDFAYDLTELQQEQGQENFENEGKDQDCQKVGCQTKLVDVPQVNNFLFCKTCFNRGKEKMKEFSLGSQF